MSFYFSFGRLLVVFNPFGGFLSCKGNSGNLYPADNGFFFLPAPFS